MRCDLAESRLGRVWLVDEQTSWLSTAMHGRCHSPTLSARPNSLPVSERDARTSAPTSYGSVTAVTAHGGFCVDLAFVQTYSQAQGVV
jgi:hypothetical protein